MNQHAYAEDDDHDHDDHEHDDHDTIMNTTMKVA